MALSERDAVGEGIEEGAGKAEGDDWARPVLPADPETDSEPEPATGWVGELLSIRVSAGGLSGDQLVRS